MPVLSNRERLWDLVDVLYCNSKSKGMQERARDAGTSLITLNGFLYEIRKTLTSESGDSPILLAKDACEELLKRSSQALENGDTEFAEELNTHVRTLSPVVARLYAQILQKEKETPQCENGSKEQ